MLWDHDFQLSIFVNITSQKCDYEINSDSQFKHLLFSYILKAKVSKSIIPTETNIKNLNLCTKYIQVWYLVHKQRKVKKGEKEI